MQVFISHSSQDRELATRLAKHLSQAGLNVWSPYERLYPGDNWPKMIGQALEESEVMVVLFTSQSAGGLQQHEVQFALTAGKYRGRVVPVFVGFTTFKAGKDIPWILLKLDPIYISSAAEAEFDEVVERVQALAESDSHASG